MCRTKTVCSIAVIISQAKALLEHAEAECMKIQPLLRELEARMQTEPAPPPRLLHGPNTNHGELLILTCPCCQEQLEAMLISAHMNERSFRGVHVDRAFGPSQACKCSCI